MKRNIVEKKLTACVEDDDLQYEFEFMVEYDTEGDWGYEHDHLHDTDRVSVSQVIVAKTQKVRVSELPPKIVDALVKDMARQVELNFPRGDEGESNEP